jgi:ABC-type branched-subunit amino acid transport system ATPase component
MAFASAQADPQPAGDRYPRGDAGLAARLDEVFDHPLATTERELLSIRQLQVRFGGLAALSGVSLSVGHHDLVAIIGPNGAGKSTTLNAICQLIRSSGEITFNGRRIDGLAAWKIAAAGIGRSFQDPPLIDHYTVLENILCGAHLRLRYGMLTQIGWRRGVRRREEAMARRAMTLLEFVGLGEEAEKEAGSLSFGARKLVDIVRAMVSGPRLLLLDEPSSGLDEHERQALRTTLLALREERRVGILCVEHHMDLVRAVATDVVALQAGEVLMTGTPSEVLDSARFRVAVVGGSGSEKQLAVGQEKSADPAQGKRS